VKFGDFADWFVLTYERMFAHKFFIHYTERRRSSTASAAAASVDKRSEHAVRLSIGLVSSTENGGRANFISYQQAYLRGGSQQPSEDGNSSIDLENQNNTYIAKKTASDGVDDAFFYEGPFGASGTAIRAVGNDSSSAATHPSTSPAVASKSAAPEASSSSSSNFDAAYKANDDLPEDLRENALKPPIPINEDRNQYQYLHVEGYLSNKDLTELQERGELLQRGSQVINNAPVVPIQNQAVSIPGSNTSPRPPSWYDEGDGDDEHKNDRANNKDKITSNNKAL
jgi:hypothetical protein